MRKKIQIVKTMRSLKTTYQRCVDHFPDVSNMVVRGSVCVVEFLKSAKDRFVKHYLEIESDPFYNFQLSIKIERSINE